MVVKTIIAIMAIVGLLGGGNAIAAGLNPCPESKKADVQAPRSLAGARSQVEAPRSQAVEAPRAKDGVQAPRSQGVPEAPRSQIQAPRSNVQAPRSQDVQAPRVQGVPEAPRSPCK